MLRRTLTLLLAFSLVLACSDSSGPDRGVVGTWRLQTIDGLPLPFSLPDPPVTSIEVTAEVITLVASGRFTDVNTFRITDGSKITSETDNAQGSYVVNGSTVTLTYDADGTVYTATVSGDTMTLYDPEIDLTFVYRRD